MTCNGDFSFYKVLRPTAHFCGLLQMYMRLALILMHVIFFPITILTTLVCRPLYMTPIDAIEYGMIDKIVKSEKEEGITGAVMTNSQWDKQAGLVAR